MKFNCCHLPISFFKELSLLRQEQDKKQVSVWLLDGEILLNCPDASVRLYIGDHPEREREREDCTSDL